MKKKLIIGILIILGLGIGGWVYFSRSSTAPADISPANILPAKKSSLSPHILSDRAEKFSISGGEDYPIFSKEIIADPFRVKEGEEQYFSIWAKDFEGIEKVTATIKTDKGDEVIEFQLVEGTEKEGRWEGSWLTKNISLSDSYPVEFQAVNNNNRERKSSFLWYVLK